MSRKWAIFGLKQLVVDASCGARISVSLRSHEWWNAWQRALNDNDGSSGMVENVIQSIWMEIMRSSSRFIAGSQICWYKEVNRQQQQHSWAGGMGRKKQEEEGENGKKCIKLNREKIKKHPPYTPGYSLSLSTISTVDCCSRELVLCCVLRYFFLNNSNTQAEREEERNCSFDI